MWSAFRKQNIQSEKVYFSLGSRGVARVARPTPLIFRPNSPPPLPPSSKGLDPLLYLTTKFCCPVRFASILTNKLSPGLRLEGLQVLPDFTL